MTELRFDGRVAVITGAGRGLGRTYARLLASRGAKVVVNDFGGSITGEGSDASPAEAVVREITQAGGEAVADISSVATPEGGSAIIETALDRYGRIDIVIHNAGILRRVPVEDMSQEDFDLVNDVHLRGGFHVVRPAYALMKAAGYGRIVLTSSSYALYGGDLVGSYSAAKAGLIGLSNVVAREGHAHGVKCNVILPAAITRVNQDEWDHGSAPPMTAEMVAPAVGWLAHESCSISGEMLIAAAGRIARACVVESPGVYQGDWTMEQVGEQIDAIRNIDQPVHFAPVPSGLDEHGAYSFAMAASGRAAALDTAG